MDCFLKEYYIFLYWKQQQSKPPSLNAASLSDTNLSPEGAGELMDTCMKKHKIDSVQLSSISGIISIMPFKGSESVLGMSDGIQSKCNLAELVYV